MIITLKNPCTYFLRYELFSKVGSLPRLSLVLFLLVSHRDMRKLSLRKMSDSPKFTQRNNEQGRDESLGFYYPKLCCYLSIS